MAFLLDATWAEVDIVENGVCITRRVLMKKPYYHVDKSGAITHK